MGRTNIIDGKNTEFVFRGGITHLRSHPHIFRIYNDSDMSETVLKITRLNQNPYKNAPLNIYQPTTREHWASDTPTSQRSSTPTKDSMDPIVSAIKKRTFGSAIPHAEPPWYRGCPSPYYKESHCRLRDAMRQWTELVSDLLLFWFEPRNFMISKWVY